MVKRLKEVFIEVMFELGYFQLQLPGSPLYHIYFYKTPRTLCAILILEGERKVKRKW